MKRMSDKIRCAQEEIDELSDELERVRRENARMSIKLKRSYFQVRHSNERTR